MRNPRLARGPANAGAAIVELGGDDNQLLAHAIPRKQLASHRLRVVLRGIVPDRIALELILFIVAEFRLNPDHVLTALHAHGWVRLRSSEWEAVRSHYCGGREHAPHLTEVPR